MSRTISMATGQRYGIKMICQALNYSRSSFYWSKRPRSYTLKKRCSKPKWTDAEALEFIRRDLVRSPFVGEGLRMVHALLRILDGIRVCRNRVLTIMRGNNLLSPHQGRQRIKGDHDRHIITDQPNVLWGTDGSRILTRDEGWVLPFAAVEHWDAECVGWHVFKTGTRFQVLETISMALTDIYGGSYRGIARGLSLRMDHGNQYLSDHFPNQIKAWGVVHSFAFASQPQTNGVVERFFKKTLKQEAIYSRISNNDGEVL